MSILPPLLRRGRRVVLAAALTAFPGVAAAQAVRVVVVDEASGAPVPGALVSAIDQGGRNVAGGATSAEGRRQLALPGAGTYHVLVRRIGYEPFRTAPVNVPAGTTVEVRASVPSRRVTLPVVTVAEEKQCVDNRAEGARIALVWDAATTALELSEDARKAQAIPLSIRMFERELGPDGKLVREQVTTPRVGRGRPFIAKDPTELSKKGYMIRDNDGTVEYFAPDERTFLSQEFLREHCFGLTAGKGEEAGLVGVRFAPGPKKKIPDIAGVIWIDSASAELRRVDFWFVDRVMPREVMGPNRAGGQATFERLASGEWIVNAWRLRMPRWADASTATRAQITNSGSTLSSGLVLVGFVEQGGLAEAVGRTVARVPSSLAPTAPGSVDGVVFDSLLGRPMAGARVSVRGTQRSAVADSAGRFRIDSVPAGRQTLVAEHASVDTSGIRIPAVEVSIPSQASAQAYVVSPSVAALGAASCSADDGAIVGTVRDAESGALLGNAAAVVTWVDISGVNRQNLTGALKTLDVRTDSAGRYVVCGVPRTVSVTLQIFAEDARGAALDVAFGERRVAQRDVRVALEGAARSAIIAGAVRAPDGKPIEGAVVAVEGVGREAKTDASGRFVFDSLPTGTQSVEFVRLGHRPVRRELELRRNDTSRVEIVLPLVTQLAEVRVEGRPDAFARVMAEIAERKQMGFGHHIGREQLRFYSQSRSLFHGIPGMRVHHFPPPGIFDSAHVDGSALQLPGGDWVPWIPVVERGGKLCIPTFFLDGTELPPEVVPTLSTTRFVEVEIYTSQFQVPQKYVRRAERCGVVLMWTDLAR